MALKIEVKEQKEGIIVVLLDGKLDTDTSILLKDKAKDIYCSNLKAVIFDMKNVDYISSMGIGCAFSIKREVEEHNAKFLMMNLQPQIRKVFDIVKALPDSSIFTSIEEVDQYLDLIQKKELERRKEQ